MTPALQESIAAEFSKNVSDLQRRAEENPEKLHKELQEEVDKSAGISKGVYTPDLATDPTRIIW